MYGDPSFRVPPTLINPNSMSPIIPFLEPAAGAFNGLLGAFGASRRQKRAIKNQWAMFEAQKQHQNEVNERAMAFQREMNQRNEDWNNESNVRQRVEDAGYNPYLYQNGAMSSNVNQSTPLAQNVAPTSPVDLPDPFSEFANSAIDSVKGIADILLTKQNTRNIAADSARAEYMLGRQKYKDSQKYAGYDLPTAEAQLTHTQLEDARQLMIKDTVEANLAIMTENISKSLAFDENDQPITDESGRQLMLKEVSDRSLLKSNEKLLDKIKAEIRRVEEESDLTKVKKKLEQFNLDNLAPAQVKEVYATIGRIESEIIQKKAAAEFIGEQVQTERVKRTGEIFSTGIKAKDYKYYEWNKLGQFGSKFIQLIPKRKGMAAKPKP